MGEQRNQHADQGCSDPAFGRLARDVGDV